MYLDNGIPHPKYETHAGATKRAARRWHSRSDSCGFDSIWQIGRDDGMGDNDASSQPLDDWRGVSAAFVKFPTKKNANDSDATIRSVFGADEGATVSVFVG